MSLAKELDSFYEEFHRTAPPEMSSTIKLTTKGFKESFDPKKAIQIGDELPDFSLSDATGNLVTKDTLISKGPLLISFYRGEWCPFCNMELRALQKRLPEFKAAGVNLVAISPELPDQSLSTVEKHDLEFTVLSDVSNRLARQLGIVFCQPESLRPVFEQAQVDWESRYGSDSLDVTVPATLLVDRDGVVRNTFIDANYNKRLEPSTALEWARGL